MSQIKTKKLIVERDAYLFNLIYLLGNDISLKNAAPRVFTPLIPTIKDKKINKMPTNKTKKGLTIN